jgi:hypothetical protein
MIATEAVFEAMPFVPTPERAFIVSRIIREVCRFETLFTDFQKAHNPLCSDLGTCDVCRSRFDLVSWRLAQPNARVWEVWQRGDETDCVGILYLTDIQPGMDAKAHYVFWDKDLQNKTELLRQMIGWSFAGHDDWTALKRLTVEVPDNSFALARHAAMKLGFGGQFRYYLPKRGKQYIPVEGIKKSVVPQGGRYRDMLILGLVNG